MAKKVFPKELFEMLKEMKNISNNKGLQLEIKVMDGREFIKMSAILTEY